MPGRRGSAVPAKPAVPAEQALPGKQGAGGKEAVTAQQAGQPEAGQQTQRKPRTKLKTRDADAAAGPVLRARGAGKRIDEAVLLLPTDVDLRRAECVVLRGPNGSGKTTLLRILAGTVPPSEGEATLDGTTVDERNVSTRTAIAALIGAPATYRDLTLADHLVLIDSTWGHVGEGADDRADEILELLEIDHLAERFPHELSSGQQQLFHLSMVLVRPSTILILDEPEQRLDTDKRDLLTRILLDRKADGTSLLIACHDPAMTDLLADRIVDIQPA